MIYGLCTFVGFILGAAYARWWMLRVERIALAKVCVISGDYARRLENVLQHNYMAHAERLKRINEKMKP